MLTKSELEDLLRSKNLGSTLFTSNYNDDPVKIKVAPTGIDALDAELDGGLPRGQLSEIVGARSTGRMSTLCAVLAAATGRGELVAFVDTLDAFDPGRRQWRGSTCRVSCGSEGVRAAVTKARCVP